MWTNFNPADHVEIGLSIAFLSNRDTDLVIAGK